MNYSWDMAREMSEVLGGWDESEYYESVNWLIN